MALFNPPEHLSCHHYAAQSNSGWLLIDSSEQRLHRGETEYHTILFCTQGSVRLAVGDDICELHTGQMKFIPRGSFVHAILSSDGELLNAYFDVIDFICDKIYLDDRAQCAYLHELKVKELFWNLRAYYSREELAAFLWPVLGVSKFHSDVINAFTCNVKVSDLAKRVYMATSTFYKQFREEFGETPEQWIRTQSNKQILFLIQDYDLNIGEIATSLSFGSLSSFSRYCTNNFGYSPTALRQALQDGASAEVLLASAVQA